MKIDSSIPTPKSGKALRYKLPFDGLKKGQSFFVSDDEADSIALNSARLRAQQELSRKFVTKRESGGRRVWRIS